ncbi:MAG: hypothetical protein GX288_05750 [Clostridiales bacterium]|jgi:hypothetical protein|nr:hypothetical protein [Clostridiales bacterium]
MQKILTFTNNIISNIYIIEINNFNVNMIKEARLLFNVMIGLVDSYVWF